MTLLGLGWRQKEEKGRDHLQVLWALESVLDAGGDWGRRHPGLGYTQTQERPPTPKGVALCD